MNDKIAFLKKISLFKDFNESQLQFIAEILETRPFKKGEIIFHEGDASTYMGFVAEGNLEILKWDEEKHLQFKIDEIGSQGAFGELSFLDKDRRSATIKACSDGSVFILSKEAFAEENVFAKEIHKLLISNLAQTVVPRLRSTNQNYVRSLKTEINHLKLRTQFGKFFIQVMIIFGISSIFDSVARSYQLDVKSTWFNWSYLVVLFIPLLISAKHFGFKLYDAGVTLKNWKKSLVHGLIFGSLVFLLYFVLKDHLGKFIPSKGVLKVDRAFIPWLAATAFHDYIQELMARGIAQTILQRFFEDTKGIRTVFIIALLFAVLHLHLGYFVAIAAYCLSLFLGFVYIRSYNLIGVAIIHICIDTCGYFLRVL